MSIVKDSIYQNTSPTNHPTAINHDKHKYPSNSRVGHESNPNPPTFGDTEPLHQDDGHDNSFSTTSFPQVVPPRVDPDNHQNPLSLGSSNASHQANDHVNTCVHDFLALLQTYQVEFDSRSHVGKLPNCFTRELGDTISEYVILRDPNQNEFEVHVVRKAKELYFDNGWFSLHDIYDIDFGAWVALTYVSPKLLTMRILTRWGVEVRYPCYNPPLRHLLVRSGSNSGLGSSVLHTITTGSSRPKSLIQTYVKEMTLYDIHSGTLFLPWYGFGMSAFAFVFSDLILVDNAGYQYMCTLKFGVDAYGELSCKISGGWSTMLSRHGVVEGDRVKFSIAHYSASNVVYVCIYPRIRIEDYLDALLT